MKYPIWKTKKALGMVLAVAGLAAGVGEARADVRVVVGGGSYCRPTYGYYRPAPVYYCAPSPVYYAVPRPVYYSPPRYYVQTQPYYFNFSYGSGSRHGSHGGSHGCSSGGSHHGGHRGGHR